MRPFTTITAVAAPLPVANVDTDQIIPKQYLATVKRTGLGVGLFYNLRFEPDGSVKPDFVLNQPAYKGSEILIAGANFGCGSSREHAPWALDDFGIRCVIAPSFADIFYNNCFNNGLLPVTLTEAEIDQLAGEAMGGNHRFVVDLNAQKITAPSGAVFAFELEPARKVKLLEGLDDVGVTMKREADISAFEEGRRADAPWRP